MSIDHKYGPENKLNVYRGRWKFDPPIDPIMKGKFPVTPHRLPINCSIGTRVALLTKLQGFHDIVYTVVRLTDGKQGPPSCVYVDSSVIHAACIHYDHLAPITEDEAAMICLSGQDYRDWMDS